MATTKQETILIQDGETVITLSGKDREDFIAQRSLDIAQYQAHETQREEQKALKLSAYTKLGLTTEEINAIL
jgi:hypothetical protein